MIEEKINVYCRLKPETDSVSSLCVTTSNSGYCKYIHKRSIDSTQQPQKHTVFPVKCFEPNCTQDEIFREVAKPIVDSVIKGYNGTILAYGQTNSGKTYTMRGQDSHSELGIVPRCMEYMLKAACKDTLITASYLQIYCESITDLLDNRAITTTEPATYFKNSLQLREYDGRVFVEGLTEVQIKSLDDLSKTLNRGDNNRVTKSTNCNATSSRSHAVLIITLSQQVNGKEDNTAKSDGLKSTLVLCDLAGSERASASIGQHYMRLEEAKSINLSLTALGNCVSALAEGGSRHVPFRDSKLTRLLQDSLGGGSLTSIIVTVIPGEVCAGETLSTLRFASRASKVTVKASVTRYVDYEKQYGESQRRLDEREEEARQRELLLDLSQRQVAEQRAELDRLRETLSHLEARQGETTSVTDGTTQHSVEAMGDYDTVCKNPICRGKVESCKIEIGMLHRKLERQSEKSTTTIVSLEREVAELQDALRVEREAQLDMLIDLRNHSQVKIDLERDNEGQIQQLHHELALKTELLDEKNERIDELQVELESTRIQFEEKQNGSLVPLSKLQELESVFALTVDRLSSRLQQLEEEARFNANINKDVTIDGVVLRPNSKLRSGFEIIQVSPLELPSSGNAIRVTSKHPLRKALDLHKSLKL